jgi:hypothetical protein
MHRSLRITDPGQDKPEPRAEAKGISRKAAKTQRKSIKDVRFTGRMVVSGLDHFISSYLRPQKVLLN